MSRSSDERFFAGDRAAVEPLAALVAVLVVGAALGLYTVALDEAAPDRERPIAEATLDRVEPAVTVGGIVKPERLTGVEKFRSATTVELAADGKTWRIESGDNAPEKPSGRSPASVAIAERTVTVRVAPGRNVQGTLRAVVSR